MSVLNFLNCINKIALLLCFGNEITTEFPNKKNIYKNKIEEKLHYPTARKKKCMRCCKNVM